MTKQMSILLTVIGFGLFTCKDKPLEPERINPRDPEYVGPKLTELDAPPNNATIDTRLLEFKWKETVNAERYQFQAGTSANFDADPNTVKTDTTVAQTSFKPRRLFEPAAIKTIFWRVRGIKVASGESLTGEWSQPFRVNLIKPQIKVEPESLKTQINFGTLCRNATKNDTLMIKNVGNGKLNFSSVVSDTARQPNFVIIGGGGGGELNEGGSRPIILRFQTLTVGDKTADLEITTNDRDHEKIVIKLKGTGTESKLEISSVPPPGQDGFVDFGIARANDPNDAKAVKFNLTNTGPAAFRIRNVSIRRADGGPSEHFVFDAGTELSFPLSPMLPKTLTVLFAPTNAGDNNKQAILKIEGDCSLVQETNLKGTRAR